MLRRVPSLKLRAVAIFAAVFAIVFIGGFLLIGWRSLAMGSEQHHAGPTVALTLAEGSLSFSQTEIVIGSGTAIARLAARNPGFWLLADYSGSRHAYGPVPQSAVALMRSHGDSVESLRFHVTGPKRPYSDASMTRYGPILLAAGGIDPATITLGDTVHYTMRQGLLPMLAGLGLLGLLAMLAAAPLLTAALRAVSADALAIRPDSPSQRLREHGVPIELLPLVRSFNAALDRLAEELARRRRFIADVAHELRTPLAILSLQIDALPSDGQKVELERVVARTSQLVAQMLDVERLSLAGPHHTRVDLVALAREVVADLAPLAVASGYELELVAPATPIATKGDPHAMSRALANLIGNAIAHGGGNGDIRVVVDSAATIDVIDSGPGVPVALRSQIFEPFTRERWDRDGCGMGLHLVREIMRVHGGSVELLDTVQGAAFRLMFLPAAGANAGLAGGPGSPPTPCDRN